jgi:hypothetical protein
MLICLFFYKLQLFLAAILPSSMDKYDEFFEFFVVVSIDKVFPKQKKLNSIT